jgi:biopolymer transport protein ExbB/TolQ
MSIVLKTIIGILTTLITIALVIFIMKTMQDYSAGREVKNREVEFNKRQKQESLERDKRIKKRREQLQANEKRFQETNIDREESLFRKYAK